MIPDPEQNSKFPVKEERRDEMALCAAAGPDRDPAALS